MKYIAKKIQHLRNLWCLATSDQELLMLENNQGIRYHIPITQCKREFVWDFAPTHIIFKELYTYGDMRKESSNVFALPEGKVFDIQGKLKQG
jgi:hypothetical protein